MQCSSCRHENPSGAKFCEACGARFADPCPQCGAVVSAAARFCHECGRAQGGAADVPPLAASEAPAHPVAAVADAERRQLTVMFCDLVGSTELSTRLDPEDLRGVVRAYQHAASDVVARFSGHIAQYLGDGLLIYFGYPEADEHDAERAVRAGLELLAAVGDLGVGGRVLGVVADIRPPTPNTRLSVHHSVDRHRVVALLTHTVVTSCTPPRIPESIGCVGCAHCRAGARGRGCVERTVVE